VGTRIVWHLGSQGGSTRDGGDLEKNQKGGIFSVRQSETLSKKNTWAQKRLQVTSPCAEEIGHGGITGAAPLVLTMIAVPLA